MRKGFEKVVVAKRTREEVIAEVLRLAREARQGQEAYQGYTNWDTWETVLIFDNDEFLYHYLELWKADFEKKIAKGIFSAKRAEKAINLYVVAVARGRRNPWKAHLTTDDEIDPNKVNKMEVLHHILTLGE